MVKLRGMKLTPLHNYTDEGGTRVEISLQVNTTDPHSAPYLMVSCYRTVKGKERTISGSSFSLEQLYPAAIREIQDLVAELDELRGSDEAE